MRMKSYFAASVEGALAQARGELGDEAMIVHSRRTPPESRHCGEYEVVLATVEVSAAVADRDQDEPEEYARLCPPPAAPPVMPQAASPATPQPAASEAGMVRELAAVRREVEGVRRALEQWPLERIWPAGSGMAEIYAALVESDLEPMLAREMVNAAAARLAAGRAAPAGAAGARQRLGHALRAEIEIRVAVDATLGCPHAAIRVAALVGPPGAGKTTALVKLAVQYGLSGKRGAVLLSLDTHRVAAADQLRRFASILGMAFQAVETLTALAQALQEYRSKDLVLIDTAGYGAAEMEDGREVAQFVAQHPDIDTHLVLSASTKSADLTRAVKRFEIFRPAKLIFTRLDETESFGPLVGEVVRTGKALSFLSCGQLIPEHLEPARSSRVAELVLPERVWMDPQETPSTASAAMLAQRAPASPADNVQKASAA
jgi:flagellar biosynthesis protein FlhF